VKLKVLPFSVTSSVNIAVVVPCFRVKNSIIEVIQSIGSEVTHIIVVDDACPDGSGKHLESISKDKRLTVLYNKENLGVGGAVKRGYVHALNNGAEVVLKLDGDGQMDPKLIKTFINPILTSNADYVKGNRFFDLEHIKSMPKSRIFGNLVLSFFSKFSTGYWRIFDPNNGFTAISASTLQKLNLEKIDNRYFFESDILFRLNLARAVVVDVPMMAQYGSEVSNLRIKKALVEFPLKHSRNFLKRIAYTYYLRDFTLASLELPIGLGLTIFGIVTGTANFIHAQSLDQATPTGTLILICMSVLLGIQLILSFFAYDIDSAPTVPIGKSTEICDYCPTCKCNNR
jgi:dolichol-phosphate mannosyltransferase